MISNINSLSSSSISLLFGTSAASGVAPASAAQKLLGEATGNTDDVFKAGNAIGNIIEIASRIKQERASAEKRVDVEQIDLPKGEGRKLTEFDGDQLHYGVKGTFTTTYHGNGERTETFVGLAQGRTDEAFRQGTIDGLKRHQPSPQTQAALAAYENGTVEETDIAELGFKSSMTMTTNHYSDGRADLSVSFDLAPVFQFREQYTETRDGVLYDKATGKLAALNQNGSKFIYSTW